MDLVTIAIFIFSIISGVIGWLLASKDAQQGKFIEDLYNKHEVDVAKLAALELLVASDHYRKPEVDGLFQMMRTTLSEGFDRIEKALHEHIRNDK